MIVPAAVFQNIVQRFERVRVINIRFHISAALFGGIVFYLAECFHFVVFFLDHTGLLAGGV